MQDYIKLAQQFNALDTALFEAGLQPVIEALDVAREELEYARRQGYVK